MREIRCWPIVIKALQRIPTTTTTTTRELPPTITNTNNQYHVDIPRTRIIVIQMRQEQLQIALYYNYNIYSATIRVSIIIQSFIHLDGETTAINCSIVLHTRNSIAMRVVCCSYYRKVLYIYISFRYTC